MIQKKSFSEAEAALAAHKSFDYVRTLASNVAGKTSLADLTQVLEGRLPIVDYKKNGLLQSWPFNLLQPKPMPYAPHKYVKLFDKPLGQMEDGGFLVMGSSNGAKPEFIVIQVRGENFEYCIISGRLKFYKDVSGYVYMSYPMYGRMFAKPLWGSTPINWEISDISLDLLTLIEPAI